MCVNDSSCKCDEEQTRTNCWREGGGANSRQKVSFIMQSHLPKVKHVVEPVCILSDLRASTQVRACTCGCHICVCTGMFAHHCHGTVCVCVCLTERFIIFTFLIMEENRLYRKVALFNSTAAEILDDFKLFSAKLYRYAFNHYSLLLWTNDNISTKFKFQIKISFLFAFIRKNKNRRNMSK